MAQYLGQVVGTKMNKTVKVCVTSLRLHPSILKVIFIMYVHLLLGIFHLEFLSISTQ